MIDGSLLRWLGDCYREDRARGGVENVFSSPRLKHRRTITDEDRLACGFLPEEILPGAYAQELSDFSQLYRRERELLYGAIFVCGMQLGTRFCAPLIWYQADLLGGEGNFRFEIDHSSWRLNGAVLPALSESDTLESALYAAISDGILDHSTVEKIRRAMSAHGIEADALHAWPQLERSGDLEKTATKNGLKILPAAALMSVERSTTARGVLDELDRLSQIPPADWSAAMRDFFGLHTQITAEVSEKTQPLMIPAQLSEAQERIVRSARNNALTVCHGPPGTGKTFTISAITIDHLAHGESVLILSKGDHAVDVAKSAIDKLLQNQNSTMRAGRKQHLRSLLDKLDHILSGAGFSNEIDSKREERELKNHLKQLKEAEKTLSAELSRAVKIGGLQSDRSLSFLKKIVKFWHENRTRSRLLLMEMAGELEELDKLLLVKIRACLREKKRQSLAALLRNPSSLKSLRTFVNGLRKRHGSQQENGLLISKDNHATFAIDLVGFPGAMKAAIDIKQSRVLSRSQIKNVPLGITEWRTRRQECLEALENLF